MDGLDALLNEAQQERDSKQSSNASKTTPATTPAPLGRVEPKPRRAILPPGTPRCAAALKAYLQRLLDPEALEQISRDLSKRSFEEVDRYAMGHPELAKYTIEQELPRMEYVVITPVGERLTTAAATRDLEHVGLQPWCVRFQPLTDMGRILRPWPSRRPSGSSSSAAATRRPARRRCSGGSRTSRSWG